MDVAEVVGAAVCAVLVLELAGAEAAMHGDKVLQQALIERTRIGAHRAIASPAVNLE